jgi:hypothetical protein
MLGPDNVRAEEVLMKILAQSIQRACNSFQRAICRRPMKESDAAAEV